MFVTSGQPGSVAVSRPPTVPTSNFVYFGVCFLKDSYSCLYDYLNIFDFWTILNRIADVFNHFYTSLTLYCVTRYYCIGSFLSFFWTLLTSRTGASISLTTGTDDDADTDSDRPLPSGNHIFLAPAGRPEHWWPVAVHISRRHLIQWSTT